MISAILSPMLKWIVWGLLVVCLVLGLALSLERRHSHKLQGRVESLSAELKRISTERNEQRKETAGRIKVVTRTIREADGRAKVVETAPLPGQCRTPTQVLKADL